MRGKRLALNASGAFSVENHGDWSAYGVSVLAELLDEFSACGRGMAGFAAGQIRPRVEQAVAIHENADESHCY